MGRVPINRRILTCDGPELQFSSDGSINLSDTVFEFMSEEFEEVSPVSIVDENEEEEDDEKENGNRNDEDNNFWKTQNELLKGIICRTSSLESRIRKITKEALREAEQEGNICSCGKPFDNRCRNCMMKKVSSHLQNAGFNSAICKSKWRSSPDIPSGEHTFIDVIDHANQRKGEIRVIVELNFRAEFEMARASEEYNLLIGRLPEIFVGKIERLLALLKVLCSAGKKCMKDKKMHLAPWRKHSYMQAKWLRTCERFIAVPPLSTGYSGRPARPRGSMLTVDLMENFPSLHRTAVGVA